MQDEKHCLCVCVCVCACVRVLACDEFIGTPAFDLRVGLSSKSIVSVLPCAPMRYAYLAFLCSLCFVSSSLHMARVSNPWNRS